MNRFSWLRNRKSLPFNVAVLSIACWLFFCVIQQFLLPGGHQNLNDALLFSGRRQRDSVSSLGYCNGNESLLFPYIRHDVCRFSTCLVDRKGKAVFFELEAKTWELLLRDGKTHEHCVYPSGGQVQFENSNPGSLSMIFTVHVRLLFAAKNILRVYLTLHEINDVELLVIDDGSLHHGNHLRSLLYSLESHFGASVIYMRNSDSIGFGAANNQGLKQARGELVVLINSDVVVFPGWLALLVWTKQGLPEAGIVGPLMLQKDGRVSEAGGLIFNEGSTSLIDRGLQPHDICMKYSHVVDYISGACILFERQKFLRFGLFDPAFYPAYFEDTDAAVVFYKNGYKTIIQPLAIVVHQGGGSYSSSSREALKKKNKGVFLSKHKDLLQDFCPFPGSGSHLNTLRSSIVNKKQGPRIILLTNAVLSMALNQNTSLFQVLSALREWGFAVTLVLKHFDSSQDQRASIVKLWALGISVVQAEEQRNLFRYEKDSGMHSTELAQCNLWDAVYVHGLDVFSFYKRSLQSICPKLPTIVLPFYVNANTLQSHSMRPPYESKDKHLEEALEYNQHDKLSIIDGIDCVMEVSKKQGKSSLSGIVKKPSTPQCLTRTKRETAKYGELVTSMVIIMTTCEEQNKRTISWLLNAMARFPGSFSSCIAIASPSQLCTEDHHQENVSLGVGKLILLKNSKETLASVSNAQAVMILQNQRDFLAKQAISISVERRTPVFISTDKNPVVFMQLHPHGPATLLTGEGLLHTLKKIFFAVEQRKEEWPSTGHIETLHLPSIIEQLRSCVDKLGLYSQRKYKCSTST